VKVYFILDEAVDPRARKKRLASLQRLSTRLSREARKKFAGRWNPHGGTAAAAYSPSGEAALRKAAKVDKIVRKFSKRKKDEAVDPVQRGRRIKKIFKAYSGAHRGIMKTGWGDKHVGHLNRFRKAGRVLSRRTGKEPMTKHMAHRSMGWKDDAGSFHRTLKTLVGHQKSKNRGKQPFVHITHLHKRSMRALVGKSHKPNLP